MKIKFPSSPPASLLLIEAETQDEGERLERWNNSVLSSKFDYQYQRRGDFGSLLLVKEIP